MPYGELARAESAVGGEPRRPTTGLVDWVPGEDDEAWHPVGNLLLAASAPPKGTCFGPWLASHTNKTPNAQTFNQ